MSKEFWDSRYNTEEYAYGTQPNVYFKTFIDSHTPGRILLPGEGEGRNAVYAALKGWDVSAVDQSAIGQKKALHLAKMAGVTINYRVEDVHDLRGSEDAFDAIALVFLHLPPEVRTSIHQKLIQMLKSGGWFLLEAFHKDQLGRNTGGPPVPEMLYDKETLLLDFKELKIMEIYEKLTEYDEGPYHQGEAAVIRMLASK